MTCATWHANPRASKVCDVTVGMGEMSGRAASCGVAAKGMNLYDQLMWGYHHVICVPLLGGGVIWGRFVQPGYPGQIHNIQYVRVLVVKAWVRRRSEVALV
jgi:hypothetical protein